VITPLRRSTYGTRSQGISLSYLHTPRTSTNGMNRACLLKAALALGGWLVTYRNKCPVPIIEPRHGRPSQY